MPQLTRSNTELHKAHNQLYDVVTDSMVNYVADKDPLRKDPKTLIQTYAFPYIVAMAFEHLEIDARRFYDENTTDGVSSKLKISDNPDLQIHYPYGTDHLKDPEYNLNRKMAGLANERFQQNAEELMSFFKAVAAGENVDIKRDYNDVVRNAIRRAEKSFAIRLHKLNYDGFGSTDKYDNRVKTGFPIGNELPGEARDTMRRRAFLKAGGAAVIAAAAYGLKPSDEEPHTTVESMVNGGLNIGIVATVAYGVYQLLVSTGWKTHLTEEQFTELAGHMGKHYASQTNELLQIESGGTGTSAVATR